MRSVFVVTVLQRRYHTYPLPVRRRARFVDLPRIERQLANDLACHLRSLQASTEVMAIPILLTPSTRTPFCPLSEYTSAWRPGGASLTRYIKQTRRLRIALLRTALRRRFLSRLSQSAIFAAAIFITSTSARCNTGNSGG